MAEPGPRDFMQRFRGGILFVVGLAIAILVAIAIS
jgi:hypothetical protein